MEDLTNCSAEGLVKELADDLAEGIAEGLVLLTFGLNKSGDTGTG